jgi:hypothetical protein
MSDEKPTVVNNHESSGWWIAGLSFAIAFYYVGDSAIKAWKEVELKKIESCAKP